MQKLEKNQLEEDEQRIITTTQSHPHVIKMQ